MMMKLAILLCAETLEI